jgi:hypothetical protein
MSYDQCLRELDDRIRDLCCRLVGVDGVEFETTLLELANALALRENAREGESDGEAAKAG